MLQFKRQTSKNQPVAEAAEAFYLHLLKWCHQHRMPVCRPILRAYRWSADFQLYPGEIALVLAQLHTANNFLVFGLGRDTPLWAALGPDQTHFLEHDQKWIAAYPEWADRIHRVHYTTRVEQYRELLGKPESLELELPETVSKREWDVILIDAPPGYEAGTPGRMQSIQAASRLVRPGGHVLVHDMDREVERIYAATFLGQSARTSGRMALFHATWSACPPFRRSASSIGHQTAESQSASRVVPIQPAEDVPPERIIPYFQDEQVEINIVNFAEPMTPRPRHEREVLLVRDPWYPDTPRLSQIRRRWRSPPYFDQVYYLSNTQLMDRWRRWAGFNSHFINIGCFVDENVFRPAPVETKKIYDAVMIGRFSWHKGDQLQRHYLAAEVDQLALLEPMHDLESSYYRDHYRLRENCAYANSQLLPAAEVAEILRQSHCGLILSAHEGICRASSEYLLSGLPVVSTASVGGRDIWYDDYNAIIVEPDPVAVKAAVLRLKQSPPEPWRIHRRYLRKAKSFRQRFIKDVLTPVFRRFGVKQDAADVFDSHPFLWWPDRQ